MQSIADIIAGLEDARRAASRAPANYPAIAACRDAIAVLRCLDEGPELVEEIAEHWKFMTRPTGAERAWIIPPLIRRKITERVLVALRKVVLEPVV